MLQLFGGADHVEPAHTAHDLVGEERVDDRLVPIIGTGQQMAVALQIGTESTHELHESFLLGDVVTDGGEAGPDLHRVGVTAGLFGRALHRLYAAGRGLVGEEGVQHHLVEAAPTEFERVGAEGDQPHRQMLVECRVEVQDRPTARRPVVAHDHLTAEQATHESDEVLHLGGGDAADSEGVLHGSDAAPQAEREASTGEALHRAGESGGDDGVAGVVVGRRGRDGDALAHRADSTTQRGCFLLVVALAHEHPTEAERLTLAYLGDEVA